MNRLTAIDHFKRVANRIQRHVLPNGLVVLLFPDHSVPIVTSMLWYRVGTIFEQVGSTGISHFLEHMMFKGSRRFAKGEIDLITTINGGSNNAFTSNDYTSYYFSFASDRWVHALEIEADRMQNLILDPAEFGLEREVILEEQRMERDDPWHLLRQEVEDSLLGDHPYRFPIIGYQKDVEALTLEALLTHYQRYYAPSNAVLVLAGDLDPRTTLAQVSEILGPIPAGQPALEPACPYPTSPSRKRIELPPQGRLDRLMAAFPAASLRQPQHYAFHLLDRILVEGKLSRFHARLVEQTPMATYVSGDFVDTAEPYLYCLRLELLPGARTDLVEQILCEELDRVLSEGITEEELERAKNQCLTSTVASFETSFDLAAQVGLTEILYCEHYWENYLEEIESLSTESVSQVAQEYLAREKLVIGVSPRAK